MKAPSCVTKLVPRKAWIWTICLSLAVDPFVLASALKAAVLPATLRVGASNRRVLEAAAPFHTLLRLHGCDLVPFLFGDPVRLGVVAAIVHVVAPPSRRRATPVTVILELLVLRLQRLELVLLGLVLIVVLAPRCWRWDVRSSRRVAGVEGLPRDGAFITSSLHSAQMCLQWVRK